MLLRRLHLFIEIYFPLPLQGKKLPPNIDEDAEEGDVSDEDSADEMEDDCKLMNGDVRSLRVLVCFRQSTCPCAQ